MFVKGTPNYQGYDSTGRIFQKIGHLRSFITSVMNVDSRIEECNRLSEWEIVELEMVVKDVRQVHEIISTKKLKEMIMR